jgi:hypothetical protein
MDADFFSHVKTIIKLFVPYPMYTPTSIVGIHKGLFEKKWKTFFARLLFVHMEATYIRAKETSTTTKTYKWYRNSMKIDFL